MAEFSGERHAKIGGAMAIFYVAQRTLTIF
jgi:hypothetical protein